MIRMPTTYSSTGIPLNWRDEQSGILTAAIEAYINGAPMTDEQLALLIEFLDYYIHAPCWQDWQGELAKLRSMIKQIKTKEGIENWLWIALDLGLDPRMSNRTSAPSAMRRKE